MVWSNFPRKDMVFCHLLETFVLQTRDHCPGLRPQDSGDPLTDSPHAGLRLSCTPQPNSLRPSPLSGASLWVSVKTLSPAHLSNPELKAQEQHTVSPEAQAGERS